MRHDDSRFLAGPNRFGPGPTAALRVALEPGEPAAAVAARLAAAADTVLAAQGLDPGGIAVRTGERTVALGVPCPNRARAAALLAHLRAALGWPPDGEPPARVADLPDGSEAPPPARVPVAAVTGTNGKSTTVRLLARVLRAAGRTPGVPTSDGVWVGERPVLAGDYTGPQGAARALAEPGVDVGVLEVARGGLLLKGLGVPSLDVAVVTNVAADHLGLDGVETEAELAWVKGTLPRAVRPGGVAVLNAADPWLPTLRAGTQGRVVLFARDETLPTVRAHLAAGGEALLARDGTIVRFRSGRAETILTVEDVPVALGGVARHNLENALAAAAAAFALGAPLDSVRAGLRAFRSTPAENPGRLNVFAHAGRTVVVDFAHNPAGLAVLLDVAEALARPGGGRTLAVIGTAGDRRDEDIAALGELAARRCATVVVKRTREYLRGRTLDDLLGLYLAGVAAAGRDPAAVPIAEDEVGGVQAALARSAPGDVVAVMCQEQRAQLWALLGETAAEAEPVGLATGTGSGGTPPA